MRKGFAALAVVAEGEGRGAEAVELAPAIDEQTAHIERHRRGQGVADAAADSLVAVAVRLAAAKRPVESRDSGGGVAGHTENHGLSIMVRAFK